MVMTYDEYLKKNKKKKKEEPKVVLGYSNKQNVNNSPKSTTNTQTLIDKYVAEQQAKKDIAPVRTTVTTPKKQGERTWFQAGAFSDGYDFGDVTKTILGTTADVGLGITKGIFNLSEGIVDLGRYGVSGVANVLGAKEYAKDVKKTAQENTTEKWFSPIEKKIDKNSLIGEKGDTISEGLGYVGSMIATGGVGGAIGGAVSGGAKAVQIGATLGTTGVTFTSAMGSGMSEAYEGGATDEEAVTYGAISGIAEAGTELIFGGLGKSINAVGLNTGLSSADDMLAKKVSEVFKNQVAKNIAETGIKMGAEGTEEVIAGILQAVGQKVTYKTEEELMQIIEDQELLESFISGAVVSGIAQTPSVVKDTKAGRDYVTGYTQAEQQAIDKAINERVTEQERQGITLTKNEKAGIREQVTNELREGKIRVAGTEDIAPVRNDVTSQDIAPVGDNVVQQAGVQDQEVNERQQNYVSEAKETDSVYRKNLNEDASKYANNSKRTHEFVNTLSNISEATGENIRLTNNTSEEMVTRRNQLIEKYAEKKGISVEEATAKLKDTVIDAYNTGDGITINVNSPKALNRLVGHEITHSLEKTNEYSKLEKIAIEYAKTKGEYDSRVEILESLYDGTNANIQNELTSDIVGDYLFTDQEFINNIQKKDRNLFQRIYDEIKHLIKLVTANTKEAKQLEQLKHSFEKAMEEHKSDKTNKVTVQETKSNSPVEVESNTQEKEEYSLSEQLEKNLEKRLLEAKARVDFFEEYLEENDITNPTEKDMYDSWGTYEQMDADDSFKEAEAEYYKTIREYLNSSIDNKGRKLSEEQIEFFKDSKARDEDGKLLTVYHGTKSEFYTFNNNLSGDNYEGWSYSGKGFYFTDDIKEAQEFGDYSLGENETQIKEVYLNITNPFDTSTDDASVLEKLSEGYDVDKQALIRGDFLLRWFRSNKINASEVLQKNGYDGVIDYGHYLVYESNQIKEVTNKKPTLDEDIRYSLSSVDSEGKELSKEQIEYFKDSKVRDEQGRLLEVYHGSKTKGINIFNYDPNRQTGTDFGKAYYFTSDYIKAKGYQYDVNSDPRVKEYEEQERTARRKMVDAGFTAEARAEYKEWLDTHSVIDIIDDETDIVSRVDEIGGETKKLYLNITNPLEVDAEGQNYYKVYPEYFKQARKNGNDGIIVKNVVDNPRGEPRPIDVYIAFNENQIKNVDNTNPTESDDIRYSLSMDNQGRKLSKEQQEYFKDSVLKDDKGRLKVYYNGSGNHTEYLPGYMSDDSLWGKGIYLTPFKDIASGYGSNVKETYVNITKPIGLGKELTFEQYNEFYKAINNGEEAYREDFDLYESDFDLLWDATDNGAWADYPDELKKYTGYDGIVINMDTKEDTMIIAFQSNQVKNVDNLNPTYDPDIRYSLSRTTDDIAPVKDADVFGKDIAVQEAIAPLQEQVKELTKVITDLQENIAPASMDLVNEEGRRRLQQMTDEDAPVDEGLFTFLDNEVQVKKKQEIINEIASDFSIKKTEARELYNKIYSIPEPTIEDIVKELEAYREIKFQEEDDYVKSIQDYIKGTRLDISEIKKQIPDYGNKYRMSNMGKGLILGNSGQKIDEFYQELSELYPNEFPATVTAEADQLELISDAMYREKEFTYTDRIDDDELQILAERIYSDIGNHERYVYSQRGLYFLNQRLDEIIPPGEVDNDIPVASNTEQTEDIAPVGEKSFEEIAEKFLERKRAKQTNTATPKVKDDTPKITKSKYRNAVDTTQRLFVNEMVETDNLAKESGNLNIKYTGDMLNSVAGEIEGEIQVAQTDNEGHAIGKSLSKLFAPAKEKGLYDAFNDYLEHYSNIDRHAQGKGSKTPLNVSQTLVKEYEKSYPEFKQWGKDVWKYGANVRDNLIDAGIISEEHAETLGTMYPHYVPYMENREMSNYNPDLGEIKPKGVIKRAKGGAENLLPIEDALTKYTFGYKKAVRQNQFYQEIVKTLGPGVDVGADVRNDAIDFEDTLYKDETGNYLTAYVNGERVSTRISDDLYTGLKNDLSNQIKGLEEKYALITEPVQKLSEIRRNLLTSWNPMFIIRNPIMDVQDALFNSKYTKDFMKNYPKAFVELGKANTETAKQFLTLYGSGNVMGEHSSDGSVKNSKFLKNIQKANNIMELAPRYAEFKASLENGASIQEAMYNAREVTTNFSRGGTITKALNKNGFTFLNVSVQGFDKFIRNFSGENGAKGVAGALLKATVLGVVPALFNELAFGGDEEDEEYEALPDYIKDNYYLIKTDEGEFIRIPKGRMLSVFGSAGRRTLEFMQGEEDAFAGFLKNANSQVGISNPLDSNILTPLIQAYGTENGEAWYGGDLVPSRLQKKAPEEQYDASTDKMSIWLGDKLGISPYKLNYVLDQYSGGIGDIFLPFITEESTSDAEGLGMVLAPIKDQFTANSTSDNKYASEIYSLSDEMDKMPEATKETDEYKIQDSYLYSVTSEMAELYAERREVQADKDLSKSEKYKRVQAIQDQINSLAKEGMENYQNISKTDNYAIVGGREFNKYTTDDGTERWGSVFEDVLEDLNSLGMDLDEKSEYFKATSTISSVQDSYKGSDDFTGKKQEVIGVIKGTNLTGEQKAYLYDKYYGNSDVVEAMVSLNVDIDSFLDYEAQDFTADKYANGKTVPNSKKRKVFEYINSMPIEFEQRLILAKLQYPSYNEYNPTIIEYLNNSEMTYEQVETLLRKLDFEVDENGQIRW